MITTGKGRARNGPANFSRIFSQQNIIHPSLFAVAGVCLYIVSLAYPFQYTLDVSLLLLAITSVLAIVPHMLSKSRIFLPFLIPVAAFIAATEESLGSALED